MASNSTPNLGSGLTLKEPQLYDVLSVLWKQILLNLHCVKIGIIQSYNAATKTANIQIVFSRVKNDGTVSYYPQLLTCPVVTLQGGGYSMQFPIAVGDTCLILFSDRNIDAWYASGGQQPPPNGRLHDLSDAIALVGLNWSADTTIATPSTTEARLIASDGFTKVGLSGGKITVQNSTQNLLTVLNALLTALESLTVTVSGGTGVVSAATVAALEAVGTNLAALLY